MIDKRYNKLLKSIKEVGWAIAIKRHKKIVKGLIIGEEEYINDLIESANKGELRLRVL